MKIESIKQRLLLLAIILISTLYCAAGKNKTNETTEISRVVETLKVNKDYRSYSNVIVKINATKPNAENKCNVSVRITDAKGVVVYKTDIKDTQLTEVSDDLVIIGNEYWPSLKINKDRNSGRINGIIRE
jgi:hypothetical protein